MRIAYHPTGSSLTLYAINLWVTTSIANWPTVGAGTLITVSNPQYPFRLDTDVVGDDRTTRGGVNYSKILYTRKNATIDFDLFSPAELTAWRTFYTATKGFRLPFIVEHPLTLELVAMSGGQEFPFSEISYQQYKGSVKWGQYL